MGGLLDAEYEDGLVVELGGVADVVLDVFEDALDDRADFVAGVFLDGEAEAVAAVLDTRRIEGVLDAVGRQDDEIAGLELDNGLLVAPVVEEADRDSGGLRLQEFVAPADDGGRSTGIGHRQASSPRIPKKSQQCRVLSLGLSLGEALIEISEEVGGPSFAAGQRAEEAADEGGVKRRRGSLAGRVAEDDGHLAVVVVEEVEQVAGDLAGGLEAYSDFQALDLGRVAREEDRLEFTGGLEVVFHTLFALGDLFVQTGVLDGAGDGGGEQSEGASMFGSEIVEADAFEVQNANDAVAEEEGDGDFGMDVGVGRDVAGVGVGILNQHGLAGTGGGSGDALAEGDGVGVDLFVVADGEGVAEDLVGLVEEEDGKGVVANERADDFGEFAEEIVEIEDGGKLLRDAGEGPHGAVGDVDAAVEAGVVNRDPDARGEQADEHLVVVAVGVERGGLEVDDPDEAAAGDHGSGEFAADGVESREVVRVAADVVREDGFAGFSGDAGEALA